MPELPEVETVRLGLEPVMRGRRIVGVVVNRFDLRGGTPVDFAARVQGSVVRDLVRRGKYIVLVLDNDEVVIWHLGMSGRVRVYDSADLYKAEKHDHVIFDMEGGARISFCDPRRFGMMYLAPAAWEDEKPFVLMGPEPLGNGFDGEILYRALRKRKGPIKSALLDQAVVAGLGNIYVCEALYMTGIDPARRGMDVREEECARLVPAIRDVLNAALASGGSSLRDHVQTDGEMGYFQHQFKVYGREGEVCVGVKCNAVVERIVQAGRSTFYCARCQV